MRRMRVLSIIVFIAALAVFGVSTVYDWIVLDYVGPKITMDEESITVSVEAGEEELLAGIHAADDRDGDVTDSLILEGLSDFIEKGRRIMTVAAFDADNHVTKISREVIYSDYHSPRFSLSAPLRFPVGTQNILSSMGAEDVLDGNLTTNIKISGEYSLQASTPGDYPMLFTVANSAGDVSELPVTVQIYDQEEESRRPSIVLSQYLIYTTPGTAVDPWNYVQAVKMDNREFERGEDGILYETHPVNGQAQGAIGPQNIMITQDIDYNVPGVYEIVYQITNSTDRTGTVRLVVVVSD